MKLTQKTIETLACPEGAKDRLVFDSELCGFGIRITPAAKIFLVQYQTPAGKRRVKIGAWGALTVERARREARALLGDVARGRDPYAEKLAQAELERQAKAEAVYTFGHMVEAWADARNGDRRESYLREAVLCLKRNLSSWLERPAALITLQEAVRALDALKAAKGTVAANRTLAYARAAYSWACKRQALAANPLKGIEQPGREVPRERVLTPHELAQIWRACDSLSPVFSSFVRVLMLTLQRREEVGGLRWDELSPDLAVWTLPGERAKNGKAHVIHLSEPARAIIREIPRVHGNGHVFASGSDGKHISAYGVAKQNLEHALDGAIGNWRFHDFRRSGVTALAGMGVAPHVADKLLNHVTGTIQGVAAVYQRHEFLVERRTALDLWAKLVLAAVEGREAGENMVQFAKAS
jgi:integrase